VTIDLIFITYNRLEYTRLSLASVLADSAEEFSLTIWDNGSTDGTKEYLASVQDPRIVRKVLSPQNVYLHGAANDMFFKSSADLVGIIPNDFLVTPGWTRPLAKAHADVPEFGMIGCWHFFPDDFDYERAKHKIQTFGQHRILRHPWTGGGAGLVKLKAIRECGPPESSATTQYWTRMALRGYINGFYYPLIYVEHMDDPKSKHSHLKDEASYQAAKAVTANINSPGQETLAGRWCWRQEVLNNLLDDPWDAKYYIGWRSKLRRIKKRATGLFSSSHSCKLR
jgi:glycosyltransferase involved in cell wall biosynthesis